MTFRTRLQRTCSYSTVTFLEVDEPLEQLLHLSWKVPHPVSVLVNRCNVAVSPIASGDHHRPDNGIIRIVCSTSTRPEQGTRVVQLCSNGKMRSTPASQDTVRPKYHSCSWQNILAETRQMPRLSELHVFYMSVKIAIASEYTTAWCTNTISFNARPGCK